MIDAIESYQTEWKGPTCHTECFSQLQNLTIHFTQYYKNVTHHYVSIGKSNSLSKLSIFDNFFFHNISSLIISIFIMFLDSSCNVSKDYLKYIWYGGSAIGIFSLTLILLCTIVIVCKIQRTKRMMKSK